MAAYLLFDKYEEMKDPVAWMKRQEEYAEHEHSKQLQAAHAAPKPKPNSVNGSFPSRQRRPVPILQVMGH